jgi:hypothetical protein
MGSLFFEIKEGRVSSEAALFRIKKKVMWSKIVGDF